MARDEDATPSQSPSGSRPSAPRGRDKPFGPFGPTKTARNNQERKRKRKRKRKQELPASGANPPVKRDRKRKSNKEKTFTALNPWEQDDAYSATPSPSTVDDQEVCKSWGHRINNIDGSCVCDL